eukprot:687152-Prorocentrum_minimum.AAC.1
MPERAACTTSVRTRLDPPSTITPLLSPCHYSRPPGRAAVSAAPISLNRRCGGRVRLYSLSLSAIGARY